MSMQDDHRQANADVRHPNTIPNVPPPPNNDPEAIRQWASRVMDAFGLTSWTFSFDNARRRMGCCHHRTRRITMSRHFIQMNGPAEIRDTVLHEVAHALIGPGHGHDAKWKEMARRVGARPERCGRADMPAGSWRAECPACSRMFSRHRKPRRVSGWHCRLCGPRRGVLIWELGEEGCGGVKAAHAPPARPVSQSPHYPERDIEDLEAPLIPRRRLSR